MRLGIKILNTGLALGVSLAMAQQPPEVIVSRTENIGFAMAGQAATFQFISADSWDGKIVANAPYSADAVTETTRILADGTRIVNKNSVSLARDSQGRTRREQKFAAIGPWVNGNNDAPVIITINDPVTKESYILHPNEKAAERTKFEGMGKWISEDAQKMVAKAKEEAGAREAGRETKTFNVRVSAGAAVAGAVTGPAGGETRFYSADHMRKLGDEKEEQLGKQNIEGLICDGKRVSHTIAIGEIGNDRPITTVTERWYSPELQTLVMSKTVDPQMGETVYKLANVSRGEPAAYLFRPPADYTVRDNEAIRKIKLEKALQDR